MIPRASRWLLFLGFAGGLLAAVADARPLAAAGWVIQADTTGSNPGVAPSKDREGVGQPAPQPAEPKAAEAKTASPVGAVVEPWPKLGAQLFLHVLATVFGLRAGMKLFYENSVLAGFVAVVAIDTLVVLAMELAGPFTAGASAMLGPQAVFSAVVMVPALYHFGFTKDRVTVLLAVAVGKTLGTLAEVALRFLFLDALLRHLAGLGG